MRTESFRERRPGCPAPTIWLKIPDNTNFTKPSDFFQNRNNTPQLHAWGITICFQNSSEITPSITLFVCEFSYFGTLGCILGSVYWVWTCANHPYDKARAVGQRAVWAGLGCLYLYLSLGSKQPATFHRSTATHPSKLISILESSPEQEVRWKPWRSSRLYMTPVL